MASSLVEVDGSTLEGGGQILRMSMAFSALLGIPIRVHSIRAGRSQGGLRAQHLKGLEMVRDMCRGKLEGGVLGSTEIIFRPGKLSAGHYAADTQTAGSVGLLIQVALPCALFANGRTELNLRGGTNASFAPQIDYTVEVFKPLLNRFGASFDCQIIRRGYFPRGGGEVYLKIDSVQQLKPLSLLDPGEVISVQGWSYVAGVLPVKMAKEMSTGATELLTKHFPRAHINIECYKEAPQDAVGNGSGINLVAETNTGCLLGGSGLGSRELTPVSVGQKAAEEIIQSANENVCVDKYSQDQIVLLMALASGLSRVKCGPLTLHTQTAIHVAELMTKVKFNATDDGILECEGIGLKTSH